MKLAIITCGILPIPAVQGGAVENLIDFYLDYNDRHRQHDITVYSIWDAAVDRQQALSSTVNHYHFVDVSSLRARMERKLRSFFHRNEYYNYFIEYYFEKVYAHLRKNDYDYILLENSPGHAYKLAQRGYRNLILHLHNDLLSTDSRFHEVIAPSFRKVITVSDYINLRVSTIVSNEYVQTVHNGIDLTNFSRKRTTSVERKELGLSDDDFVMLYSGRINKDKGVAELIEALLSLKEQPKIKLLIIGGTFFGNEGDEDDFVRSLKNKAKAIEQQIVFTGFIPYQKMPDYLQLADVAVIPSIWNDPFPTTVLEAQAMGLPIITTLRGGIPEEVTPQNAILLATDHQFVSNLSNAILDLYQHPEKCKLMAAASLERAHLFNKEEFARNFFEAIEKIR